MECPNPPITRMSSWDKKSKFVYHQCPWYGFFGHHHHHRHWKIWSDLCAAQDGIIIIVYIPTSSKVYDVSQKIVLEIEDMYVWTTTKILNSFTVMNSGLNIIHIMGKRRGNLMINVLLFHILANEFNLLFSGCSICEAALWLFLLIILNF